MTWLLEMTWLQIVQIVSGITTITSSPFAPIMLCLLIIGSGVWVFFKVEGLRWRGATIAATLLCLIAVILWPRVSAEVEPTASAARVSPEIKPVTPEARTAESAAPMRPCLGASNSPRSQIDRNYIHDSDCAGIALDNSARLPCQRQRA